MHRENSSPLAHPLRRGSRAEPLPPTRHPQYPRRYRHPRRRRRRRPRGYQCIERNRRTLETQSPSLFHHQGVNIRRGDGRPASSHLWETHRSSAGQIYYYNAETDQSQWEKPSREQLVHRLEESMISPRQDGRPEHVREVRVVSLNEYRSFSLVRIHYLSPKRVTKTDTNRSSLIIHGILLDRR